jgi:predicted DNA binding CopG/RHH family protein
MHMPSKNKNAQGKAARDLPRLDMEAANQKALEQVEAELEAAREAKAPRNKLPKDAFLLKGRTKPVAVRFDEFTLERLRTLAARRNTGYQTLLKEFVVERLYEEEKREGIIE